jgi:hypothetical protein
LQLHDLLANVRDIVPDYRKLTALVLMSESFCQTLPSARKIGDDLYGISDRDGLMHEQVLVLNRSAAEAFSDGTLAKLYRAFSH